ncbi:putative DNA mismatch repair protein (Mlh3) [Aspergillus melleus]|uniref:putative DNA mismatch repair protein (Mlh3) n=1 Tax=Aspergillus melleus TaxID=138277 RepID=UPI001E8E9336|nr:DNA mismatch repair protein [Aspergillus melleus]KAH8428817.1 DNA mismatch repair protein [Aspergillus melleus]
MSGNEQKIQSLPSEVVAKLKSSTSITHLNGVVVELVKNALDANAHTVYVTIDFQRGGCVVDDDGDGIPPTEFESDGGLGKPYHTSRFNSEREVYGRRGSFLASLASLSLLTITSHHVHYPSKSTVIFHHSTPVARLVPAPASRGLRFSPHGTSITVNDLFGNMPVRVKNRALAFQKSDELDRQWDELRQLLVSLMLANDRLAKLVISDASREKKVIIRPRNQSQSAEGALDLQRISSVLAQAGLAEFQNTQCWNAVSATLPDLSIHAAISLKPSPTKKVQFISVGMNPIYARNSTNLLYSETNSLFSSSDFGAMGGPPERSLRGGLAEPPSDHTGTRFNPMTKLVNKWPMFYIRIDANAQEINDGEDVPESDKSIQRIMDVLAAMMNEFLKQHGLRPRARKRKRTMNQAQWTAQGTSKPTIAAGHTDNASTEETLNSRVKLPEFHIPARNVEDLGNWSKAKSARDSFKAPPRRRTPSSNPDRASKMANNEPTTKEPAQVPSVTISMATEDSRPVEPPQVGNDNPPLVFHGKDESTADRIVSWIDPYTRKSHLINSRTGQSVSEMPHIISNQANQRPRSTGCIQTVRTLKLGNRPKSAVTAKAQNFWVSNLLDHWENPAFARSEQPIHAIDSGHSNVTEAVETRSRDTSSELCGFETFGISKFRGKLLKQDLQKAEVIAQVDHKFVLARLNVTSAHETEGFVTTLVLIDQHAADERCRVEALFEELFTPSPDDFRRIQTITLDPLVFEIPSIEKPLFGRYRDFFGSWGIEYTVEQKPTERSAFIFVHRVPLLIAERCRMEPILVIELIRGELWGREETRRRPDHADEDKGWVGRLKGCPQGLIDLLNSRACRTAIMFNDELTAGECQHLVNRLAQCVFPFQCAHGRPSMIPIVDMIDGLDGDEEQGEDLSELGLVEAFQNWQSR